jgi:hypothetical protein
MPSRRHRPTIAIACAAGALAAVVLAGQAAAANLAAPQGAALDRFLAESVPVCMRAPAVRCVDQGFAFADTDGDGKLALAEVRTVQERVDGWARAHARSLPPAERERLIVGLLIVQAVGPTQLFASYDIDGDGFLTREEVTADFRLDPRPLPEILSDPAAIDWNALAARAGDAAPLLRRLLQL